MGRMGQPNGIGFQRTGEIKRVLMHCSLLAIQSGAHAQLQEQERLSWDDHNVCSL